MICDKNNSGIWVSLGVYDLKAALREFFSRAPLSDRHSHDLRHESFGELADFRMFRNYRGKWTASTVDKQLAFLSFNFGRPTQSFQHLQRSLRTALQISGPKI